jgi:hypothetical protein
MHSPSIDYLYTEIGKHILLARSYTEIPNLAFIIKACRLKPYDILLDRNKKLRLHKRWVDEFGNTLQITKDKKINITYNDLSVKKKITCTDLYYGLSIDKVVKMSKLIYLCAGKDEDLYQDCYLLALLGMDDYLRAYLYWYGEWQQVSPLLMGMEHLQLLAADLGVKYFYQLDENSKDIPIPCVSGKAYLSFVPLSQDFLDIVKKQYEMLLPILGQI